MATGFPYHDIPLDREQRQIRVLDFEITTETHRSDPVVCTTSTISLDQSPVPDYYAVSYTWGDQTRRRSIEIDGHNVSIGENAYNALRTLRLHRPLDSTGRPAPKSNRNIRIWMDAVCINQSDVDERGWQVGVMNDLYATAAEVLVYLGEDTGRAKQAFELVLQIQLHCQRMMNIKTREDVRSQPGFASGEIDGTKPIFAPEPPRWSWQWWSSFWWKSSSLWKSDSLCFTAEQWKSLEELFARPWFTRVWVIQEVALAKKGTCYFGEHMTGIGAVVVAGVWLDRGNYILYTMKTYRGVVNARSMYRSLFRQQKPFELLSAARTCEATDARDKVYALLGLIQRGAGNIGIEPDYTKSVVEVYRDVTWKAIQVSNDIRLLELAGHATIDDLDRLPSWVPDYNLNGNKRVLFSETCFRSTQTEWREIHDEPNVLSLRGAVIDRIVSVDQTPWSGSSWAEFGKWLWSDIDGRWRYDIKFSLDEFASSFAFGIELDHRKLDQSSPFYESFRYFVRCMEIPDDSDDSLWNADSKARIFFLTILGRCTQSKWFVTAGGRMGMCPRPSRPGDAICHLYGGDRPYLLRPDGARWVLLGMVHLHDLANTYPDVESIWFDIH